MEEESLYVVKTFQIYYKTRKEAFLAELIDEKRSPCNGKQR